MEKSRDKLKSGIAGDERCRFRPVKGGGLRMVMRLTMRCDLNCPHCLAARNEDCDELATGQWLTLIRQFPDIGVKKALLTGGEPLLRNDIAAIVGALSNAGIQTDLNSNLQRMNRRLVKDFKQAGLSEISVSLEGPEKIHNSMHGSLTSYSKLVEAIKCAVECDIPVDASCCLTTENYSYISHIIHLAQELSIRSLTFSRLLPIGHGYGVRQPLTQEQLDACYQAIQSEMSCALIPIRVTGLLGAPEQEECGRGNSLVAITPDGRLLGCALAEDNPDIPPPLDIGLGQAMKYLCDELAVGQYSLCWKEGI